MPYKSLNDFVNFLEKNNELIRIHEFVDTNLQITEITDRISKTPNGGKALLFENNGTPFPVLINAMGSYRRMCMVLGVNNLDDIGQQMDSLFKEITSPKEGLVEKLQLLPRLKEISSWMPKIVSGRGKCQEVIHRQPDLSIIPVLKCWPQDGGKFITLPMVNTKDPHTGIRNVGMYRLQIFEKNLTGMHWHKHKVGARHYNEYKQMGKKMPIAVAIGGDLIYTYSATAPLPDNIDEYMLAGFLRKKKVELVKCITQDIEVPADADFIIEGYVDTQEDMILEGPFGDHTGFYSLPDLYPRFHVTCITHRKNAVYPTTIVGIPPQEDAYIGKATERIFVTPIKMTMLPELCDMDLPFAGVAHNLTIASIKKEYPAQAAKAMSTFWGAGQMMFNKTLIITGKDVDVHNYTEVAKAIAQHTHPATDIYFSRGPLDVLDHSASKMALGGKLCIDATPKLPEEIVFDTTYKPVNQKDIDIEAIRTTFELVDDVNTELLKSEIPCLIVSYTKTKEKNIPQFATELCQKFALDGLKFIVVVDKFVDIHNLTTTVWICLNNIDVSRDCSLIKPSTGYPKLLIDGTIKTKENDNFERDWPNAIVSTDETIKQVDEMWNRLNIGNFVESPSKQFKKYVFGNAANIVR